MHVLQTLEGTAAASEAVGLRARKKARVRHELAAAGLRLISERDFDSVTVEEIAAAVDVSVRTFYRYFPTKEDLVFGNEADTFVALSVAFQAQPADLPIMAAVRQMLISTAEGMHELGEEKVRLERIVKATASLKLRQAERQSAWECLFAPLVSVRLGESGDKPSLHAQIVAASALAVFRVALASWKDDTTKGSLVERVTQTFDLLHTS